MQFIFHGTGTSSALPLVPCITSSPNVSEIKCRCCREAVTWMSNPSDEEEDKTARVDGGWKNKRGNTSGILRKRGEDGEWRTIVIDVGKTFRDQASWLFRKHQIRRIDAVILTHGHADAIAGLGTPSYPSPSPHTKPFPYFWIDDLRAFTAPPSPQAGQVIPIYLSRTALDAVGQQFPYLVDKSQATGGGDVPSLVWRVFDDPDEEMDGEGFDVCGVKVVPLPVHHGKYFTPPDKIERLDAPQLQTQPSTPPQAIQPASGGNRSSALDAIQPSLSSLLARKMEESISETVPFYCHGFVFDGKLVYLSDISYIPSKTWNTMIRAIEPLVSRTNGTLSNDTIGRDKLPFPATAASPAPGTLPCLILDCLRLEPHVSHLSFCQALSVAQKLGASETFLVGFTHPASHNEWEAACKEVQGIRKEGEEQAFVDAVKKSAIKQGEVMDRAWEEARSWRGFVRPGFDGQVIEID
ncbi:hypothetical protein QFC20_003796 [Naganishia adeliensis]|uniref:Uncharacterized protein n=1 Tax=Naganishia adeliensis TaxID=92952 RepID=A0ACC2W7S5_9TREE|nr:hypothetical protein QFC20_003796 [Naganishia adeliensis]